MRPLRQSTSTLVTVGPLVTTNGAAYSPTNITGTLYLNGVPNFLIATTGTNYADGTFALVLPATNLATAGRLTFAPTNSANYVPRVEHWDVYPAGVYDLLIGTNNAGFTNIVNADVLTSSRMASGTVGLSTADEALLSNLSRLDVTMSSSFSTVNGTLSTLSTAVNNLNNLSALANLFAADQFEVPASGSIVYPITMVVKDSEGHLLDLSASPTITVANGAGTDRSANLSAVSHPGTGQYTFTYTVSSGAAQEGLQFKATGTASSDSTTRLANKGVSVVSIDTTSTLAAIFGKVTNLPSDPASNTVVNTVAAGVWAVGTRTITGGTVTTSLSASNAANLAIAANAAQGIIGVGTFSSASNLHTLVVQLDSNYVFPSCPMMYGADDGVGGYKNLRSITESGPAGNGIWQLIFSSDLPVLPNAGDTIYVFPANPVAEQTQLQMFGGSNVLAVNGVGGVLLQNGTGTGMVQLTNGQVTADLVPAPNTNAVNAFADGLLDRVNGVETGWTLRGVFRLIASVLLGKVSNGGATFRDLNDTKNRVAATVDSSGNRTAVTKDVT